MSRRATRRALLATAAASLVPGWSRLVAAQPKRQPVLIGWFSTASRESRAASLAAFKQALAELGWKEGVQVTIETRWADGRLDRLPALAQELVAMDPALIVTSTSTRPLTAVLKVASHIPLVQAAGGDLVSAGLAKTFARPGGMATGMSGQPVDLIEKHIQYLNMIAPRLRRFGFLLDPNTLAPDEQRKIVHRVVQRLSIEPKFAEASQVKDIEPALASLVKQGAEALVVLTGPFYYFERERIMRFADAQRWPVAGGATVSVQAGALLTYQADLSENFRRSAYYVDRILKGAKPGDLPIEQPRKFELVLNANAAKRLALSIPQELQLLAHKVIE